MQPFNMMCFTHVGNSMCMGYTFLFQEINMYVMHLDMSSEYNGGSLACTVLHETEKL